MPSGHLIVFDDDIFLYKLFEETLKISNDFLILQLAQLSAGLPWDLDAYRRLAVLREDKDLRISLFVGTILDHVEPTTPISPERSLKCYE